ncbi:polyketide cyclase [Leptospira biflexa]|uniref:nuclear transport factor 2 family protein n=1 Tax=Leptospira biflexa TaxID=172 RepID=UPI001082F32B|nr:nuclear transport factor 2 family protein [Leptospira biflexa]TGM34005.1 polyketide cyclase [Leptospira biflexa]TGM39502.1 polyketide cyclase [Leptospira biflexa]TGM41765.1 polyketide cyclase [Leptospira biflexa]TGM51923.1 polyketide cyclase [Leptospira biflexa]
MNTNDTFLNKKLVLDFFDAINKKDIPRAMAYVDESIDWWVIGKAKISGHKDFRLTQLNLKFILRSFESFQFKIHDVTSEENRVAITVESIGKHKTGKNYNNHYHFLFFIKKEKIIKVKEYFDTDLAIWLEVG